MVIRIGVIGDFNPAFAAHTTTDGALGHAAAALGMAIQVTWCATPGLARGDVDKRLAPFDGIWISAGSPYRDREGAFAALRFARQMGRPLVAT